MKRRIIATLNLMTLQFFRAILLMLLALLNNLSILIVILLHIFRLIVGILYFLVAIFTL